MKARFLLLAGLAVFAVLALGQFEPAPEPTVLVVRMDMPFDEVVQRSTFPVLKNSTLPSEDPSGTGFGATFVSQGPVIVKYDAPENGFELPPTKFAGVEFGKGVVQTVATSPMMVALPYEETLDLLDKLQKKFKAAGWIPWRNSHSEWFDLSPQGRKQLFEEMFSTMRSRGIDLVVPKRNLQNSLAIHCVKNCYENTDQARFLINVGMGKKSWTGRWNGE